MDWFTTEEDARAYKRWLTEESGLEGITSAKLKKTRFLERRERIERIRRGNE